MAGFLGAVACVMACVVACVVAKSAKFFDRINYNLDWIVCGCYGVRGG